MEQKIKKSAEIEKLKLKQAKKESEISELFAKAGEIKEQTFQFDNLGEITLIDEIDQIHSQEIDNPNEKFDLYYKAIRRVLMKHLPKGKNNKDIRELIYREKNTYLTRGHIIQSDGTRGADSRMGYNADMRELVAIIDQWIQQSGTAFDLYTQLQDLNKKYGYNKK